MYAVGAPELAKHRIDDLRHDGLVVRRHDCCSVRPRAALRARLGRTLVALGARLAGTSADEVWILGWQRALR